MQHIDRHRLRARSRAVPRTRRHAAPEAHPTARCPDRRPSRQTRHNATSPSGERQRWGRPRSAVAALSPPNTFTKPQAIQVTSDAALTLTDSGASAGNKVVEIQNVAGAIGITMQTDWSANINGNTTYDSIDVIHKGAGD